MLVFVNGLRPRGKKRFSCFHKSFARRRESSLSFAFFHQRAPQLAFKLGNVLVKRWTRDEELLCGCGEIHLARKREELFQIACIQVLDPPQIETL